MSKNNTTTKNNRTKIAKVQRLLHDLPYTTIITNQIKTSRWLMVDARVDDIHVTFDIVRIDDDENNEDIDVYNENIEVQNRDRSVDDLDAARAMIIDTLEGDDL